MGLRSVFQKLEEMAVNRVDRIGDYSATADPDTSSVGHRTDRKLMRHPKTERLIRKAFSTFPQNINVIMINDKVIRRQLGQYRLDKPSQKDISNMRKLGVDLSGASINIVFVGSSNFSQYTTGRGPMSAWMLMHRFWQESIENYNYRVVKHSDEMKLYRIVQKSLCMKSATLFDMCLPFKFRSAREDLITGMGEYSYELFTEYSMFGKIRINPAQEVWEKIPTSSRPELRKFEKQYYNGMKKLNQVVAKLAQAAMKSLEGKVIIIS